MGNPIDKLEKIEIKFPSQGPALGFSAWFTFDHPEEVVE